MKKTKQGLPVAKQGFIALIASVLISTVLLGLSSTVGMVSWYARLGVAEAEDYALAKVVAQSCVAVVELRIAERGTYTQAEEEVLVGDKSCVIEPGVYGGGAKIKTHAKVGSSVATITFVY